MVQCTIGNVHNFGIVCFYAINTLLVEVDISIGYTLRGKRNSVALSFSQFQKYCICLPSFLANQMLDCQTAKKWHKPHYFQFEKIYNFKQI